MTPPHYPHRPDLHVVPPVDYDTRPNLYSGLTSHERETLNRAGYRLSFTEAVRDIFDDRLFCVVFGFVAGCLVTVILAWLLS